MSRRSGSDAFTRWRSSCRLATSAHCRSSRDEHHGTASRRPRSGGRAPRRRAGSGSVSASAPFDSARPASEPGAQRPRQPGQLGTVGGHVGGEHLFRGVGDVVVEGLGEGGVGHARAPRRSGRASTTAPSPWACGPPRRRGWSCPARPLRRSAPPPGPGGRPPACRHPPGQRCTVTADHPGAGPVPRAGVGIGTSSTVAPPSVDGQGLPARASTVSSGSVSPSSSSGPTK